MAWKDLRHLFFPLCHPPLSPRHRMFDFLYVMSLGHPFRPVGSANWLFCTFVCSHVTHQGLHKMVASALKAPRPPDSIPCGYWPGSECLDSKVSGERLCQVSLPKFCLSPRSWEPGQGGPSHTVTVPFPAVFPRKKVESGKRWASPAGRASICWAAACTVGTCPAF